MSAIKTVSVIGASGNIGAPTVQALLESGFQVTALTRECSTSTFPPGVNVKSVVFASLDSRLIVDACVAVGVKRFIPSEFGVADYKSGLPYPEMAGAIQGKLDLLDYLQSKSDANPAFTWTRICTGLFLEWALTVGHLRFDKAAHAAGIFDSGDEPFHVSSYPFIGKAMAAVLSRPKETANRYLVIASFTASQNKLLHVIEELYGQSWTVEHLSGTEIRKAAEKETREKGRDAGIRPYQDLLACFLYADGMGAHAKPQYTDNKLLGFEEDVEDPKETLREWLAGRI
ncbi:hypothetical protein BDV38DRAFT_277888 [Aspergillus pseudotamarii]|uniref:NmrA-like domain-containing protein n=1 Tax=Aspergillus pseudotamarii TaxID=132259 RepID=A0A5N6T9U6_ASPPS|nr:uncharacterized protein BDV38DRAFT_277888 [Aspergillus pseudotamarii]KAE8143082.1 hypothetical protein BDV38DRAFT_277888 [Aspergillus pseudotamarii]